MIANHTSDLQKLALRILSHGPMPREVLARIMREQTGRKQPGHALRVLIRKNLVTPDRTWVWRRDRWVAEYVLRLTSDPNVGRWSDDTPVHEQHIARHAETVDPEWICQCRECCAARKAGVR